MTRRVALSLAVCLMVAPMTIVHALTLTLPGAAQQTVEETEAQGRISLPITAWRADGLDYVDFQGQITRRVWRLGGQMLTTTQLAAPLRSQLIEAGFDVTFECLDRVCGGFDFRFKMGALGAPTMHVDVGDFQYILAQHPDGAAASLVVSRAGDAGFVQLTHVEPQELISPPSNTIESTETDDATLLSSGDAIRAPTIINDLLSGGRAPLDDLQFPTGSSELQADRYQSLAALASYLTADPSRRIVLVGHSDTEGGLDANVTLSERRAASVRRRLLSDYGVDPGQVSAEGIGFLAPRRSNDTEEGRRANRRVEVVLSR